MKKLIMLVCFMIATSGSLAIAADYLFPGGKIIRTPRRVALPSGKVFKIKWFRSPERLKEFGIAYWKVVRPYDQTYYKSTGYTDAESVAPNGVKQVIRTHTFKPRYTIEQGKAHLKEKVIDMGQSVVTQQVKELIFDPTLPTANLLAEIEAVKAAARARRLELNAEIDALTTYEEIIQYKPQWSATSEP